MTKRFAAIVTELKSHAPFTLFGSLTGVICMLVFRNLDPEISHKVFYVFHPGHVFLSAIVIASLFQLYSKKSRFIFILIVGCIGAVGVGTISDSVIPFAGELVLGMDISHSHGSEPAAEHAHENEHDHGADAAHEDSAEEEPIALIEVLHVIFPFIEGWYIVFPAAILGVLIAFFKPKTRFPHAGHVLLSTWASSFHMLMAMGGDVSWFKMIGSFGFLFLAVWIPCCFSDIVFPLLFVKSGVEIQCHHH